MGNSQEKHVLSESKSQPPKWTIYLQGLLILGLLLSSLYAEAKSDRDPSVPGITIGNFHLLSEDKGRVYRGAEPIGHEQEAAAIGVNQVLIYKKQNKKEVDREIQNWKQLGLQDQNIHHLPAAWKDLDVQRACEHTVTALQLIKSALETPKAALYLHCTHGEDRTGLVSGLFRVLHDKWTLQQAFQNEMCARGYEAGSPTKPDFVVSQIRKGLTPLLLKFARLEKDGVLGWNKLDLSLCADIGNTVPLEDPKNWRCQ